MLQLRGEDLMFRFIASLLKRKYNPCRCCEVTQRQLNIANEEKKQLMEFILNLVKPEVKHEFIIPGIPSSSAPQVVRPASVRWDHRQRELEKKAREKANTGEQLKINNPAIASEISKLEKELSLEDESAEQNQVGKTI